MYQKFYRYNNLGRGNISGVQGVSKQDIFKFAKTLRSVIIKKTSHFPYDDGVSGKYLEVPL